MPRHRTKSLRELRVQRNRIVDRMHRDLENRKIDYDTFVSRRDRANESYNRYVANIERTKAYVKDKKASDVADRDYFNSRTKYGQEQAKKKAHEADARLDNRQYPTSTYRDAAYSNRPKQQSTPALNTPSIANEASNARTNNNASTAAKGSSNG